VPVAAPTHGVPAHRVGALEEDRPRHRGGRDAHPLMVAFYFIFVSPLGLLMRVRGGPLHLKAPTGSNWTPHRNQDADLG